MIKPVLLCLSIAASLATVSSARADFLLEPTAPAAEPASDAPSTPVPLLPPGETIVQTPLPPPWPYIPIARGYGHRVPLSFAVRQIVPPTIKVVYANAVDKGETVDWQGGSAWTTVLLRAVEPLGLRIRREPGSVEILTE